MNFVDKYKEDVTSLVIHQLSSLWTDIDENVIKTNVPLALSDIEENFLEVKNKRFFDEDSQEVMFSSFVSVQWMIFLYRLSNRIWRSNPNNTPKEADLVYYLNKSLHANDWFYQINLPKHFMCEHPLSSVLGKASYGDYLFVYQGTTIGGNRRNGELSYPVLGNNVTMYANSTILGDTIIGNNVIISANTYIINTNIPDNCIVFGSSPNLIIKEKTESQIREMTSHIWNWKEM